MAHEVFSLIRSDPEGEGFQRLLFEQASVVDLFAGGGLETFGFLRGESRFGEEVCTGLCDLADGGIDFHFVSDGSIPA